MDIVNKELLSELFNAGFEDIKKEDYWENTIIDWEKGFIQIPFKMLSESFINKYPDVFTGEYNDCYLNISNGGYNFSIQINRDYDEIVIPISSCEIQPFLKKYEFAVYGYDKDRGARILCGLCDTREDAEIIAEKAYIAEQSRTDVDREEREVYDIDCIFICDGIDKCYDDFEPYIPVNLDDIER